MPTALTDRVRQHPSVPHPPAARGRWTTPRVLLGALAVSYLTCLGALVAWSVLPLAVGWSTYVVQSDSMAPAVRTGDALVTAPVDAAALRPGNVVVVDDPAVAGRVLSHRVDSIRDDGLIVTRGDANPQADSTPVRPDALRGLARLRIPLVGLPGHWVAHGSYAAPLGLLAVTAAAVAAAATDPSRRRAPAPARALWRRLLRRAPHRGGSPALVLLAGSALTATTLGVHASPADAAFAVTTDNGPSSFAARADWVAPDTSAVTVAKVSPAGYLGGAVRPGQQYRVHAAVTDTGNPPSGIASVTADVSTVTAGQTARTLPAAASSVQGVSYTRRSATVTAGASTGPKAYSLTMTDAAANARTRTGYTVSVDGTAPVASDVQATNTSGGTAGVPETGDTLSLTYSEQIDPYSVLASWTGAAQGVTLRVVKSGPSSTITVVSTAGATLPLGSIAYPATWANGTLDFTGSTMTLSGSRVDIVLGTPSTAPSQNGSTSLTWTPDAAAYDAAGNTASTSAATESGASDPDF